MNAKLKITLLSLGVLVLASVVVFAFAQQRRARRVGATTVETVTSASGARTIRVRAGGNLQSAVDAARPGDTVVLEAGAVYYGEIVLPNKQTASTEWITIQSSRLAELPAADQRVTPVHAELMPKIVSRGRGASAVSTALGAHHYRLIGLEIRPENETALVYDLVRLGDGSAAQNSTTLEAHHLTIDRCYVHAFPAQDLKRGLALNARDVEVTNSYFSEFKARGQDTQAIAGWNGSGNYKIINNYLEAAGYPFILGGADPRIPNLVPSNVEFRRNTVTRPVRWREAGYTVKNLFELKNARRVLVEGNLFENNWAQAQSGIAILFTVRNEEGNAPWSVVEDVEFRHNIVRHSGGAINILGTDNLHPSQQVRRIQITNNLFDDIGGRWGGRGVFVQITGRPREITVEHNTVLQSGSIIDSDQEQTEGFIFRANITQHNEYGIRADGSGTGNDTITRWFPNSIITQNALIGAGPPPTGPFLNPSAWYPASNFYPRTIAEVGFVDAAGGNYRLTASSPYRLFGCDFNALNAAMGNGVLPSSTGR